MYTSGSFREDILLNKLVRIVGRAPDSFGIPSANYVVENTTTGHEYEVPEWHLSQQNYNEMEVLAWASR